MTIQPNPTQVKKDLENWARKLREAHAKITEVYNGMNEVYKATMEVNE